MLRGLYHFYKVDNLLMHPVIRILALLLGALIVVLGGWLEWLFALTLTAIGYFTVRTAQFRLAAKMMLRLRWLLLSMFIIYLWFTPGIPLWPEFSSWSPSREGVIMGLHRVVILLLLVSAVSLLLQSTPRTQMVAALLWLLRPLALFGFPHERFAVRVVLTMEAVVELQEMERPVSIATQSLSQRVAAASAQMVDLFDQVTQHAHSLPCHTIEVPILKPPSWLQWLLLLIMFGVFLDL